MLRKLWSWPTPAVPDVARLKEIAARQLARRHYRRACATLARLVAHDPSDPHLARLYADALRCRGRLGLALMQYRRAAALHARAGEFAKASALARVIVDLAPDDPDAPRFVERLRERGAQQAQERAASPAGPASDARPASRLRGSFRLPDHVASLLLVLLASCVEGAGQPCRRHSECLPGLVCSEGACAECARGRCLGVDLDVDSCEVSGEPLAGVSTLRARLESDGQPPRVRFVGADERSFVWEDVGTGTGLRVTVEGLASPDALEPVSKGVSVPFDLPDDVAVPAVIAWLRPVRAFVPSHAFGDGERCSRLLVPRAGHSATAMPDGTLLLVGGDRIGDDGARRELDSGETYDPRTGRFDWLPDSLAQARTGHTATLLADGRLFVAGGEATIGGKASVLGTAEIWDPQIERWSQISMRSPRRAHTATLLPDGRVLLAGGDAGDPAVPLATTEVFDPRTRRFTSGPTFPHGRNLHAAALLGQRLVLAGGQRGARVLDTFETLLVHGEPVIEPAAPGWSLSVPRREPHLFAFDAPVAGLLAVGAPDQPGSGSSWDWLTVDGAAPPPGTVADPPVARSQACAASFDGGALVAGGRDAAGGLLSSAEVYAFENGIELTLRAARRDLAQPRARATCTRLADGTLAVAGGDAADGTTPITSYALELFRP